MINKITDTDTDTDNGIVWLIAGGRMQLPMVQEIKRRGYKLLLTDGNADCYCRAYADIFHQIDTYDIAGHLALAKQLVNAKQKPNAVLTDAADVGMTVSYVAQELQLPSVPVEIATKINYKHNLRIALGLTYPVSITADHTMDYSDIWYKWRKKVNGKGLTALPCIIKPSDNCASRGIVLVNGPREFEPALDIAFTYTRNNHIIIEEKLNGTEIAIDWFVLNGKPYLMNCVKRIFRSFGIERGHINPYSIKNVDNGKIHKIVQKAVTDLGITDGPLKTDFINDKIHSWCIVEAATRWSGGYDHGFTQKYAMGFNLEKILLDYALGLTINPADLTFWENKFNSFSACYAFYEPDPERHARLVKYGADITQIPSEFMAVELGLKAIITQPYQEVKSDQFHNAQRNVFIITHTKDFRTAWINAANLGDAL